jgi:hypothetical protein
MSTANAKAQQKWHPQHGLVIVPKLNAFAFTLLILPLKITVKPERSKERSMFY